MTVWAVQLTHQAYVTWNTLCDRHVATRAAERDVRGLPVWIAIDRLRAVDIACADCETERQAAPGYVTPVVRFVATGAGARLG